MSNQAEQDRINRIYRQWNADGAPARYAWHRQEILLQEADRARVLAALLPATIGANLSGIRAIDVGCGNGAFLRQLIDWGAQPANLAGTELQPERLEQARQRTAQGVRWHLGSLDAFAAGSVDLVSAETVFSSILDDDLRRDLAAQMWRVLRPGGWAMILDFRYSNPRNLQVRKVSGAELLRFWPAERRHYRSVTLAPPLSRAMARLPYLVPELLAAMVPLLRSHFFYMAQKED